MSAALLILAWLTPLGASLLAFTRTGRWLTAIAPLPALAAAWLAPAGGHLDLDWVLLGTHLGLDETGRLFLLFSGMLWFFAGIYTALRPAHDERVGRFTLFFLLAMAGNLLLILAADMVTFYFGFALMGLAAYGLVVHRRSQGARRAGRVYLGWTLVGELALFSGVVLLAAGGDSVRFVDLAQRGLPAPAVVLLIAGFGVKLALPGLHVWLPLTYAAAPPAAAAVLSGPMINAGLLGWLRFMPPGATGLAGWGEVLVAVGMIGAGLGVLVGVTQRDPRAVLGYSSIAKMGLIAAGFGTALARPEAALGIVAALALFAMQHLLVKGALFLGLAEWEQVGSRPWVLTGLTLLALALAGAPLTAGAAAKTLLSYAVADAGEDLSLLFLGLATGTVLLMARFLWLVAQARPRGAGGVQGASLSWLVLTGLALWLPFSPGELSLAGSGLGPLLVGLLIAGIAWELTRRGALPRCNIPAGDLLHLISWRRMLRKLGTARGPILRQVPRFHWRPLQAEGRAPPFATAGWLWLAVVLLLLWTILLPG
jgi:formate hydrogenlyase subunit 3/multisubunit Na+/H+ antiporter MnhD subunit